MIRLLLLEDEQLAADRLRNLLQAYFGEELDLHWVQSVRDGRAYLEAGNQPDLIISDIELLDGSAFKLYDKVEVSAPIIFVTAYDQYLLEAFQTNGVGYVLKPYTDEALHRVLDKYQKLLQQKSPTPAVNAALIEQLTTALGRNTKDYKERFVIKKSSGIYFLKTVDIKFFQSDGDLLFAIEDGGKKHLINFRISALEQKLDPQKFFRLNRGQIINVDFITKMESYFGNRLSISVKGEQDNLITSGPKTAAFRKWTEGL